MTYDVDAAAKHFLDIWIHLLDLKKWAITFTVVDEPINGDPTHAAHNTYGYNRESGRRSLIQFYRPHMRNDRDVEEAVIHELLHLLDVGLGLPPALHRFIARLERPLRLARKRAANT